MDSDDDSDGSIVGYQGRPIVDIMFSISSVPDSDSGAQLANLTELCQAFAYFDDDDADDLEDVFEDHVVRILIKLASSETTANPNVALMSVRALAFVFELMPDLAHDFVAHGVLRVLCAPLEEVRYIDVAEECLRALEMLSRELPVDCLKAGVLNLTLAYLDFFHLTVQIGALSTAVNVCKEIPQDSSSTVMNAVPTLCNLLKHENEKLVESAATCLMRIVKNFSHSSELLTELCKHGLVNQSVQLVVPGGRMVLSKRTYTGLIKLLARLASRSFMAVRRLFDLNIIGTLGSILKTFDFLHSNPRSLREDGNLDQMRAVLKLLIQLFPPITRDDPGIELALNKKNIIHDQFEFLLQFGGDILPVLIKVVNSGADTSICYGCVSVVENVVNFTTLSIILEVIKDANLSSFLAGLLLSRKDHHVLISTLKIAEMLMKMLPDVFLSPFVKEGVVFGINALSQMEDSDQEGHGNDQNCSKDLSGCLCYAFDPCSHLSSEEVRRCRLQELTVPTLAKRIKTTYFREPDMGLSGTSRKLNNYCKVLKDNVDGSSTIPKSEREEYLSLIWDRIMEELHGGESLSTFEFIESGIVRSLAYYLSDGNYPQGSSNNNNSSDLCQMVLNRFRKFSTSVVSQRGQDLPLTLLTRNLQNALSFLDRFPVVLSIAYDSESIITDVPVKQSTARPCLKVHFVTEEGETDLCKYDGTLTIEFSSSFDAIEEVLWPKVTKEKAEVQSLEQSGGHQKEQSSRKLAVNRKLKHLMTDAGKSAKLPCTNASQKKEAAGPKLIYLLNEKQLDRSITLYQAILDNKISEDPDIIIDTTFWDEVHRITLRKVKETAEPSSLLASFDTYWQKISFFSSMVFAELPCKLEKSNPSYDMLFMLKTLEGLNQHAFRLLAYERRDVFASEITGNFNDLRVTVSSVPQTEFISSRLTDKLEQQLQDSLALSAATMPSWCSHLMAACPFLFSFEARWKYFCLNTFGSSRNQMQHFHRNSSRSTSDERSSQQTAALPRKKFKVNRKSILTSAKKMMAKHAYETALIEIEYNGEIGTGLGPTVEFYTLVGHEFQKIGMGMWRGDKRPETSKMDVVSEFIDAPCGLFPRPWFLGTKSSNGIKFKKVMKKFFLLGQFIARAIRDRRILDFTFSRAFYKLILEKELDIYDIQSFDPQLGWTLIEFQALAHRKRFFKSGLGVASDFSFRNARIEDLCLDFTLPAYSDYVLAHTSNSDMVDINNLEEYVSLVVDATARSGISRQMEAFKLGFNEVFPLEALQIFTEEELERILCGENGSGDFNELLHGIRFCYGYTWSSPQAISFLQIIKEFGVSHRRAFLQFVTGAPRLPLGGLDLTVVRKHCNNAVDQELPSVMTCATYLKLPPYTSKDIMREKLLYAILEGQGSFHLS